MCPHTHNHPVTNMFLHNRHHCCGSFGHAPSWAQPRGPSQRARTPLCHPTTLSLVPRLSPPSGSLPCPHAGCTLPACERQHRSWWDTNSSQESSAQGLRCTYMRVHGGAHGLLHLPSWETAERCFAQERKCKSTCKVAHKEHRLASNHQKPNRLFLLVIVRKCSCNKANPHCSRDPALEHSLKVAAVTSLTAH